MCVKVFKGISSRFNKGVVGDEKSLNIWNLLALMKMKAIPYGRET